MIMLMARASGSETTKNLKSPETDFNKMHIVQELIIFASWFIIVMPLIRCIVAYIVMYTYIITDPAFSHEMV